MEVFKAMIKGGRIIITAMICITFLTYAYYFNPGRYVYINRETLNGSFTARTHRITGDIEYLHGYEWKSK